MIAAKNCSINYHDGKKFFPVGEKVFLKCFSEGGGGDEFVLSSGWWVSH